MANVSQPAWRFHAVVEVVRRFMRNADFDLGFRGQNAEDCSDWFLRFLRCRGSFLNWCDEPQAIEVASLALSTLRMCLPWFLGEAVVAEKVRLLRPAERGQPTPDAS